MRTFIVLSLIFGMVAQFAGIAPERMGWKWALTGTMLFVSVSCLFAGIAIGMLEE